MLILTRKSGEKITVGDDVVVSVLEIRGSQVKLGIEAPKVIAVQRGEVYKKIQEENLLAAGVDADDFVAAMGLYAPEREHESRTGRGK